MQNEHDPFRQTSYIQQCLSQDKKALGLFLGAGCPVSVRTADDKPLIPDIAGITAVVCERLGTSESLRKARDHFAKDARAEPNVEDILSHIRALKVVVGRETVRGLTAEELDRLDADICGVIHDLADQDLPGNETAYHRVAAWIDAGTRVLPVEVFTTNYDLLMEQAFEDFRVPYFDGFAGVRRPFFDLRAMEEDQLPPRWARLWKLHGSINWFQDTRKRVFRGIKNENEARRVIHPSHLKYDESRRMPYLAMIDRLRAFLKQPSSVLTICGYSFRDDHINEVLAQGLQGNSTAIAFALLFGRLDSYDKAIPLAKERSNLSLLALDEAVIGTRREVWMERQSEMIDNPLTQWVTWTDAPEKDGNKMQRSQFSLGDFEIFGCFLQELFGATRQQPGEPLAK